jgi:hypothetical protein
MAAKTSTALMTSKIVVDISNSGRHYEGVEFLVGHIRAIGPAKLLALVCFCRVAPIPNPEIRANHVAETLFA